MTGTTDCFKGVYILSKKYDIPLIFVTLGKDGNCAYYKNIMVEAPPFEVKTIEKTGAGDTFTGCMLGYILDHGMENLTEANLKELILFANAGASLITTKKGALNAMPEKFLQIRLYIFAVH